MDTYKITRYGKYNTKIIKRELSLYEAIEFCNNRTNETYTYGYTKELPKITHIGIIRENNKS